MNKNIIFLLVFGFLLAGCDVGKTSTYICNSDCSEDNSDNSDNSVTN